MGDRTVEEIKAYVPARDFALSKQFYEDLGFTIVWSSDDLAYARHGPGYACVGACCVPVM
jgi:hypothetical protein